MCPNGHPRPSLQGIEEVAYATQPTERAPRASEATVLTGAIPAAGGQGGYRAPAAMQSSIEAESSFTAGGYGMGQSFAAAGASADSIPLDNPWQPSVNTYGIDPALQAQLDADMARAHRDVPWTESWAAIIIFLLFFWPVGIVFLWRSSLPAQSVKWGITGVFAAMITFNIIRFMLAYQVAMSTVQAQP